MKIIEQSHETIDRNQDPLKLIEICARTCYKSEDKITDISARSMIKMLINKGHLSQIEHATAALQVSITLYNRVKRLDDGFLKFTKNIEKSRYIISGNYRAFLELFDKYRYDYDDINELETYLSSICPEIFRHNNPIIFLKISQISESEMTTEEKKVHAYRTVKFITSRSVTHELVRHRPCSFSQESQRYVRYDGNMEFIKPVWWNKRDPKCYLKWIEDCKCVEQRYRSNIEDGLEPEEARGVLMNDNKTEIIITANLKEWQHLFNLRTSKGAFCQIRPLIKDCQEDFKKELPEIFENKLNETK